METSEAFRKARILIFDGYYQVSRKHRHVARLPTGKTGIQALRDMQRSKHGRQWASHLGDRHAGDQFLRTTNNPKYQMTADEDVFRVFRQLGGSTYGDLANRVQTWDEVDMEWPKTIERDMISIRAKEWKLAGCQPIYMDYSRLCRIFASNYTDRTPSAYEEWVFEDQGFGYVRGQHGMWAKVPSTFGDHNVLHAEAYEEAQRLTNKL